jgi:hypothetical protein
VRSVEFHPEAEAEFISAARYYEEHAQNPGLALSSLSAVLHQQGVHGLLHKLIGARV